MVNLEDNLNINSNKDKIKGKNKILMSRNSQTNLQDKFPTICVTNRNNYINAFHKRSKDVGFNSPHIKKDICKINEYLWKIKEDEIERKKSFNKEKLFSTQI